MTELFHLVASLAVGCTLTGIIAAVAAYRSTEP